MALRPRMSVPGKIWRSEAIYDAAYFFEMFKSVQISSNQPGFALVCARHRLNAPLIAASVIRVGFGRLESTKRDAETTSIKPERTNFRSRSSNAGCGPLFGKRLRN